MCKYYCDSIWDAWPKGVDAGIPGTGTLHYFSGGGEGETPDLGQIHNGVIGIRDIDGGKDRNTDFNLSISYILD